MNTYTKMLPAALTLLAIVHTVEAADFTIDQWFHDAGVFVPGDHDADYWTTVENPCQRTISADIGTSNSSATLNYAWGEQTGTFLFQSQQQAVGVAGGLVYSFADNQIWITPSEDLSLWVHGSYSYDLHGWMAATLNVGVSDAVSGTILFSQYQDYDTIDGPPYYGTFYVNANVLLPAGTTWVMGFHTVLDAEPGSGNPPGTGMGSFTFEVTPEPVSLAFFAPLALVLPRRSRRDRLS